MESYYGLTPNSKLNKLTGFGRLPSEQSEWGLTVTSEWVCVFVCLCRWVGVSVGVGMCMGG